MSLSAITALTILIFAAAILYSSVGHAGASGYLAAMALFGIAPAVMRPSALVLNILVASVASLKFFRAGHFVWPLFWPFALTSIPMAYLGGRVQLPIVYYKYLVGAVLLFSAYRLLRNPNIGNEPSKQAPAQWLMLSFGAVIGLLSGLTGVGGGIFLSPLLLFMGWAETRQASGISAVFILVNSISGLLGLLSRAPALPNQIYVWAAVVLIGGWIGSEYGSKRLAGSNIKRLLAVVLIIAGFKLMFT
jgi:hypothetical protein